MTRRLLNLLTALSLLMCVAVVAMWFGDFGPVHVGTNPQFAFSTDTRGNLEVCCWGRGCVHLPYWLLTVATALGPALRFDAARKKRELQRRQGRCPVCGYDLSGNVSGVCPECGSAAGRTTA